MIRVLTLLHFVLVTTGAMDSSWAMAKSVAMSHARSPRRSGSDDRDWPFEGPEVTPRSTARLVPFLPGASATCARSGWDHVR